MILLSAKTLRYLKINIIFNNTNEIASISRKRTIMSPIPTVQRELWLKFGMHLSRLLEKSCYVMNFFGDIAKSKDFEIMASCVTCEIHIISPNPISH